jgi:tetratricopeptide (TPR) repeat protein
MVFGTRFRVSTMLLIGAATAACAVVSPLTASFYAVGAVAFTLETHRRYRADLRRYLEAMKRATELTERGDLAGAMAIWKHWRRATDRPFITMLSTFYIAWTHTLLGELDQAIAINLENVERNLPALRRTSTIQLTALNVALCYALLDRVDEAERWFGRFDEGQNPRRIAAIPRFELLVRAICELRRGNVEAAIALTDDELTADEVEPGEILRWFRLVRALARSADQGFDPAQYPHEYAFLGSHWPEMAAFLAAHGLAW